MSDNKKTDERLQQLYNNVVAVGDAFKERMLKSFSDQYDKMGRLSPRQMQLVEEWEEYYSKARMDEIACWQEKYEQSQKMQGLFKLAVQYYKENPPYFSSVIRDIARTDGYVPSYQNYEKMTSNNYFDRYRKILDSSPLFMKGDLAEGRQGKSKSGNLYLVCKATGNARAAKGSREYLALLLTGPSFTNAWQSNRTGQRGVAHLIEEGDIKKYKMRGKKI